MQSMLESPYDIQQGGSIMWQDKQRNCEYCRKPLHFKNYLEALRKRFCGHACVRLWDLQRKAPTTPKPCKQCGTYFQPAVHYQVFCGRRCASTNSHHNTRHDGNGILAKVRDQHQCRLCGKQETFKNNKGNLVSHHLDGTGEDQTPNHHVDNLVTLCRKCHLSVHRLDYRIVDNEIVIYSSLPRLVGALPVKFAKE